MHVDKPQRPRLGQQCNHQAPPHFFLDFSQDKHPRSLSIPTGKHKSEFSPLTLLSFLLRKELGSSLKSPLSNPQVHTSKERQSPTPKSISLIFSRLLQKVQLLFFFSILLSSFVVLVGSTSLTNSPPSLIETIYLTLKNKLKDYP